MAKNVELKTMRCPICGAPLKAENNMDVIICVYCENAVVPMTVSSPVPQKEISSNFNGIVKVEGIKTSSSALAYIEQFFEEYDWEAFAYAQTLSIAEIDKLVSSLKVSSADDKNTWFACFKAISVPYSNKITGCKDILSSVIEEYKKDSFDAYSKFDAYKRISSTLSANKEQIIEKLENIVAKATKYGASSDETDDMRAEIENISLNADIAVFSSIESIPEISHFINKKNEEIVKNLSAKGIDAEAEYNRAMQLIADKKYIDALNILLILDGYADTKSLIRKLDKYYIISNILEIGGSLYYCKKTSSEYNTTNIYPVANGKILSKPIIKNIRKIITNHADILYYLDNNNNLKQYNLSANTEKTVPNESFDTDNIFIYGRKVFLLSNVSSVKHKIIALDITTGAISTIAENVKKPIRLLGNKMIYTLSLEKMDSGETSYGTPRINITNVINVDTMTFTQLGTEKTDIEDFFGDDYIIYTKPAPNNYNRSLFIKSLKSDEPEIMIEKNILSFCSVIDNKLFYYIGNSRNKTLININIDGTERKEWPLYISNILFEQGGWLYFVREVGYNSVLCKSRLDGSKFSIIAADIENFITLKNGYLSSLVKIRMDGTNLQTLCEDVEDVLSVQEDKVVFVSFDDRIVNSGALDLASQKTVKSIYAVDFSGSGKIKLAYNVKSPKEYDDSTVYYISTKTAKTTEDASNQIDELYKLDIESNETAKLLDIKIEETTNNKFMYAMVAMAIFFFIAFIGLVAEAPGLFALCFIGALCSFGYGFYSKANENGISLTANKNIINDVKQKITDEIKSRK